MPAPSTRNRYGRLEPRGRPSASAARGRPCTTHFSLDSERQPGLGDVLATGHSDVVKKYHKGDPALGVPAFPQVRYCLKCYLKLLDLFRYCLK